MVPVPSAAIVTGEPVIVVATFTVLELPSDVSVTVQVAPAITSGYCCEYVSPAEPAGMTRPGVSTVPSHTVWIVTSPWEPAAAPLIVLLTPVHLRGRCRRGRP